MSSSKPLRMPSTRAPLRRARMVAAAATAIAVKYSDINLGANNVLIASLAILAGLALLVWSADRFVEGSAAAAGHFGMPPLLIGMVVVGFGTSAPDAQRKRIQHRRRSKNRFRRALRGHRSERGACASATPAGARATFASWPPEGATLNPKP